MVTEPSFTMAESYAPGTERLTSSSSNAANVAPILIDRPDPLSDLVRQGHDVDATGSLTPASSDRIAESSRHFESDGGLWWEVSTNKTYDVDGSAASAITTISKRRLRGSAGGMASVVVQISPGGETVTTTEVIDQPTKSRVQTVTRSTSNLSAVTSNINGLTLSATSHVSIQPATFGYDGLGRPIRERRASGAVSQTTYKPNGQVDTTIDPFGKVTSYAYHPVTHLAAGRVSTVTNPNAKTLTYNYSHRGEVTEIAGTADYRQTYTYDVYGQRLTLGTWRDATADITTWVYQASTGLLLEKRHADNKSTIYTYHPSGKTATRTWARGVVATYSYNSFGDPTGINYSDATPDVSMISVDRLGRPLTITQDGIGSETLSYHPGVAQTMSRYYESGHLLLGGHGVSYGLPTPDGKQTYVNEVQSYYPRTSELPYTQYGYDERGRLTQVNTDDRIHTYSYHPLTSRIERTESGGVQGAYLRERRNHDIAGRLLAIHSEALNGSTVTPVTRYGYELDNLGRRKSATMLDGSNWTYGYNDRSEVTSATRKNAAGTAIPALGATYAYDGIGNRTNSTSPVLGDRTYTANNLNHEVSWISGPPTSRTHP